MSLTHLQFVGLVVSITSPFTPREFSTWEATWSAYQWVTQLAGWPEKLHVAALCNWWQLRGSLGLGQLIWDPAESDGTEITGSTGVKEVGPRKAYAHSAHCHRGRHAALSVSTLLKLSALSLRGKREYLWEGIYGFILCLTWKFGCLEMLVSHTCTLPDPCTSTGKQRAAAPWNGLEFLSPASYRMWRWKSNDTHCM